MAKFKNQTKKYYMMKNRCRLSPIKAFLAFFFLTSQIAGAVTLSPEARISLLTASPGQALYSVFGHSAVRVQDSLNSMDIVFNYGTFDFETPGFYTKFVKGKLPYMLSTETFIGFQSEYKSEGRTIEEQLLNLSQDEKQKIFDFLLVNREPENRFYQYDFFFDNCATRIRDLVDKELDINWDENTPSDLSFRDLITIYLTNHQWAKFGIDLLLGYPCDRIASAWEYQFLPDFMHDAFKNAKKGNGSPLIWETKTIIEKFPQQEEKLVFTPILFCWIIFLVALLSLLNKTTSKIFDAFFFSILGLTGILLFFMWFFTDHQVARWNLNLLWAFPLHLIFIFPALIKKPANWIKKYFLGSSIIAALLIIGWFWVPQNYHPAFFPLILASAIKGFNLAGFFNPISFIKKKCCKNSIDK